MGRRFHHLRYKDRLHIEAYLKTNQSPKEIAALIGVHESTINREIQRGAYVHRNSDWTEEIRYSPELAERKYREHLKEKGRSLKLDQDPQLVNFLEEQMIRKKYSPYAAIQQIKRENKTFKVTVCVGTCYNYINRKKFPHLIFDDLPYKRRKKKKRYQDRIRKRGPRGTSIEERPEEIDRREEAGHWEMDTVVGKLGESKKTLLVLSERKTRFEIIKLLKDHTTAEVVRALNRLERQLGEKQFRKIFKTITMDNGSEFSDVQGIVKSRRNKKNRTISYYCHAYSSWERGTNENQNRFVRRHVPKGTNFDNYENREIQLIEDWINDYPRPMFNGMSAKELFEVEFPEFFLKRTKKVS